MSGNVPHYSGSSVFESIFSSALVSVCRDCFNHDRRLSFLGADDDNWILFVQRQVAKAREGGALSISPAIVYIECTITEVSNSM